jgi:hypothetical protein
MSVFQGDGTGGFTLYTKYGETYFKNAAKYHKFQLLCHHPSTYWVEDDGVFENMCERCCMLLKKRRGNYEIDCTKGRWKGCRGEEVSNALRAFDYEEMAKNSWENEGGACGGCYG